MNGISQQRIVNKELVWEKRMAVKQIALIVVNILVNGTEKTVSDVKVSISSIVFLVSEKMRADNGSRDVTVTDEMVKRVIVPVTVFCIVF